MTKWWKCDLQVATPAWQFTFPPQTNYDVTTSEGREVFVKEYFKAVVEAGVDCIALADHNTGEWIDLMVAEGRKSGVTVFPGCEITTGSGADGIHLVVIGDSTKTSQDYDRMLSGCLGFDTTGHPRFHDDGGGRKPGSSSKTMQQILDDLPEPYLVIAPHVLNDNGLASAHTAKGDIRWRALHHPRLVAIDPGDGTGVTDVDSFSMKFRQRKLDHFPRLKQIAFVATSDAYSFESIGKRFTWIRMETPTLEALRQAFLDHEARVLCDWDPRLKGYHNNNPNNVRHAWIKGVSMQDAFNGATKKLEVDFHPGMNVIIGGRGSGKSTVVAAIRQLYSGNSTLPEPIKKEAENFSQTAFADSELRACHVLESSQDEQIVLGNYKPWRDARGEEAAGVETSFRVRVVNQKELFSRVTYDPTDPLSASRSFLSFVDEGLGLLRNTKALPGEWSRKFDDAAAAWRAAAAAYQRIKTDLGQLPSVSKAVVDLSAQLAAFDSDEAKARRDIIGQRLAEQRRVSEGRVRTSELIDEWEGRATEQKPLTDELTETETDDLPYVRLFEDLRTNLIRDIRQLLERTRAEMAIIDDAVELSAWRTSVKLAEQDEQTYIAELKEQGLDPTAYVELKQRHSQQSELERTLAAKEPERKRLADDRTEKWNALLKIVAERRSRRRGLLDEVGGKTQRLKFSINAHRDIGGWKQSIRTLLNLRADGFIEDVDELAEWLWIVPDEPTAILRQEIWREAMASGDLAVVERKENANFRQTWSKRLAGLDETARLRIATELADDAVEMKFLRDNGNPSVGTDWQSITQGSPGQRTAAMLAFVLHHGDEPLVLDQPEDDLDTEWLSQLVVRELRASRWKRQLIIVTHNANVPVNGDADRVIVLENRDGAIAIRTTTSEPIGVPQRHVGAIEVQVVRADIQNIMEGGVNAFVMREQKYNNELALLRNPS